MRPAFRATLGILLSGALLAFALREVSLATVWRELRGSDATLFAIATLLATATFPLRALRWRVILWPVAPGLPRRPLWRATAIGAMVNNVVPVRAGEVARAFALTRELPVVPFPASFASLAVDRLFDAIVVLLLLLLAMLAPAFQVGVATAGRGLVTTAAMTGAAGIGALLVVLYAIVVFPDRLIALFEVFARRVAPRFEERGRTALRAFADGLGVLRHPGRFAAVLVWTLIHWLTNALAFWVGFRAVGIMVPFSAALLVQGLIAVAVALPAAPGFFGVFELVGKTGLAFYGVGGDQAVSWALGFHLLTFIPITVIGGIYFARLGLRLREMGTAPGNAPLPGAPGDAAVPGGGSPTATTPMVSPPS